MMVSREKIYKCCFYVILATLMACTTGEYRTTNARIVERRDAGNGKIRLSYIFKVGQTTIAGVKIVDNVIIATDSCKVEYKVSNPLENQLSLP